MMYNDKKSMEHMFNQSMVKRHLAQANQHIVDAEKRIAKQESLIVTISARGHDAGNAETVLTVLLSSLEAMRYHREIILSELNSEKF